jgi:glycosyltransferase involved in cell wall biosynthesis
MPGALKVVHLITGLRVGGAEMMLYKLLSATDPARFRSVVVSLTDGGPVAERIAGLGVPVHSLGMPPGAPTLAGARALLRLLARERPHVLQTWMYHADLLGLLAGRALGVPRIAWNLRCSNLGERSRLTRWTIRAGAWLSRGPNVVVVNSEAGRAFHASLGYRPRRWAVIPNGFDLERFAPNPGARASVRAELGVGPDTPLLGLVCRHDPMKGHDTFLRAAAALAATGPEVHFVLAGRDVTPANPVLATLLAGHPAGSTLHLLGERADVPRLLAALDVATSSSSYGEGFSNVIGEAMACAVPCAVTDVGDAASVVGDTGMVVPPRDPAALAEAWRRLLCLGPDGRRRLGEAARQRVGHCYSLAAVVCQYEELYLSLCGRASRVLRRVGGHARFVSGSRGVSGGCRDECSQGQAGAPLREKKFVSLVRGPAETLSDSLTGDTGPY